MTPDLHALAGAYVLDALPPAERRRFEEHLADCETCGPELAGLTETTARLALAATQTPPPGLRDRVLAETRRTRQLPPNTATPTTKRSRGSGAAWILAAACLVLTVVLALTTVVSHQHADHAEALNHQIAIVLSAPDARTVTTNVRPGGNGTVVASRTLSEAVIVMSGLPTPPANKTYQLWLMGPDAPRSVTTMKPPTTGAASPIVAKDTGTATQVGITIEPTGGSARPTSTPIFTATLT